jgi:hypothetical protein
LTAEAERLERVTQELQNEKIVERAARKLERDQLVNKIKMITFACLKPLSFEKYTCATELSIHLHEI